MSRAIVALAVSVVVLIITVKCANQSAPVVLNDEDWQEVKMDVISEVSPDGQWTAKLLVKRIIDDPTATRVDLRLYHKSGTEQQLDAPHSSGSREKFLSEPVFSANGKFLAVFGVEGDSTTGSVYVWETETGAVRAISPKRGDLVKIAVQNNGEVIISPEHRERGE